MAPDWLPHQERVTAPLGSLPPLRALPSFRAHDARTVTPTTAPTPETDTPTVTIEQSISGQRSSSSSMQVLTTAPSPPQLTGERGGSSGGGGGGSGSRSVRGVRSSSGGSGGGEGDKMKRLQKALDRIRQLVSSRKFVGARHGADGGERVDESQAEVGAVSSAELDEEVTRGLLRAEVGADAIEDPWSVFVAKQSAVCEATCAASGKRCSEEGLRAINVCSELEKYLKCQGCEVSFGADQPALVSEDAPAESKPRMCLVNTEAPTCLGFHKLTTRLCACAAVRD